MLTENFFPLFSRFSEALVPKLQEQTLAVGNKEMVGYWLGYCLGKSFGNVWKWMVMSLRWVYCDLSDFDYPIVAQLFF